MTRFKLPGSLLLLSASALAAPSLGARLERLHEHQNDVENVLKNFRSSMGFADESHPTEPSKEGIRAPLFQVHGRLTTAKLKPGRLLYGKLLTRLVIGPDGSPALIVLDANQGLGSQVRIMGTARQAGTEGRVSIDFSRIIFESKVVTVQAQALDADGAFGLPAQVWNHKLLSVAGAMASSFIAGLASAQQTQNTSALGFTQVEPTGRNGILQGVAQTAADQSKRLVEEATSEKPVLVVEAGAEVTVMVQEEVRW